MYHLDGSCSPSSTAYDRIISPREVIGLGISRRGCSPIDKDIVPIPVERKIGRGGAGLNKSVTRQRNGFANCPSYNRTGTRLNRIVGGGLISHIKIAARSRQGSCSSEIQRIRTHLERSSHTYLNIITQIVRYHLHLLYLTESVERTDKAQCAFRTTHHRLSWINSKNSAVV